MAARRKRSPDLVHYCPGDAVGSPAAMPREQAEAELQKDLEYLSVLDVIDPSPPSASRSLPHIGGTCDRCKSRG